MTTTPAQIRVRVQPRARRSELAGERAGALLVRVTAPPVEGRANEAVCRLIAKRAGVSRAAGFEVDADGTCRIGTVMVRIAPPDGRPGIRGWSVRGLTADGPDGLPTEPSGAPEHDP